MQCKCYKVCEDYIESNSIQCKKAQKNPKKLDSKKNPKESVENADFCKPVLNKIMTTQE